MLIFLIGYMGCGKSTIGRKLSKQLRWPLVDTDSFIERREGLSVGKIFEQMGEPRFREMERETLEELSLSGVDMIVSTGGGLPVWGDNMTRMNSVGETIYICRTGENIASRLSPAGRERRPKLRGLSDEQIVDFISRGIEERELWYRQASLVIEAVPLSDDEILNIIEQHISNKK